MGYVLYFYNELSIHHLIINVLFKIDYCRWGKEH